MNRGVLQSSSPVQPMMAGGNPTGWWSINGIRSPPPLPPPAPPVFLGGVAPATLFPDHLYVPTASGASVSSSSSSTSWQDLNSPELPESCSQLLLYTYITLSLSFQYRLIFQISVQGFPLIVLVRISNFFFLKLILKHIYIHTHIVYVSIDDWM